MLPLEGVSHGVLDKVHYRKFANTGWDSLTKCFNLRRWGKIISLLGTQRFQVFLFSFVKADQRKTKSQLLFGNTFNIYLISKQCNFGIYFTCQFEPSEFISDIYSSLG